MTNEEKRLLASLQKIEDWRATVTVALGREGGAFFEDVPKHIREMKKELDSLRVRVALLDAPNRIDGAPLRFVSSDDEPFHGIEPPKVELP